MLVSHLKDLLPPYACTSLHRTEFRWRVVQLVWYFFFFFCNLQSNFSRQRDQNIGVKCQSLYLLDLSIFSELYGYFPHNVVFLPFPENNLLSQHFHPELLRNLCGLPQQHLNHIICNTPLKPLPFYKGWPVQILYYPILGLLTEVTFIDSRNLPVLQVSTSTLQGFQLFLPALNFLCLPN